MNKYAFFIQARRALLVTVTLVSLLAHAHALSSTERVAKVLKNGDLIFLNLSCGPLCDAIEEVTKRQFNAKGPDLSHVGIAFYDKKEKQWMVYEAWEGVQKKQLFSFLQHVDQHAGKIFIKRPLTSKKERKRMQKWLEQKLGLAYDPYFLLNNNQYYCSELIADAFQAVQKQPAFGYMPMYYGDLHDKTDQAAKTWIKYFKSKGKKIPQNQPGISPLGIYLNASLQTVSF